MNIDLDKLKACDCGIIFDYTIAGKRIKTYCEPDIYEGKCPACHKDFKIFKR